MLLEQFAGSLGLRFLALTFGPCTAELGAVRRSFLLRAFFLGALSEFVETDQIPHGGPRHAVAVVDEKMNLIGEGVRIPVLFDGYAQAGSILIYEFPINAV
jgi:hypothetical protein